MIQVSREPPKCKNCQKVLKWLPWKNGKPQRPVDPKTGESCACWKTKGKAGGDGYMQKTGRMFDKADKYEECEYCGGYHHIDDEEDHKVHLEVYHKDKKRHEGCFNIGEKCWDDEILYHGSNDTWFTSTSEVPRKEVRDFAKKNGIKVIRSEHLL